MADEESQFQPSLSSKLRHCSDEEKPRFKVALGTVGRERTNIKFLLYIFFGILVVCYIMFIALFFVLHFKTPEVKLRFVKVKNLKYSFSPPSFNTTLSAQMTVKNPNFGYYDFEPSTVSFFYGGSRVGGSRIRDGKAKMLKMKRLSFGIDVRSNRLPEGPNTLITDLNSGMLNLSGSGRVRGRVKLWKIINKSKISNMDCSMTLDLRAKMIKDLACR